MAYVNVADWKAEQVAEWLKGLDDVVLQYIRLFLDKKIDGQKLLDLQPNDLEMIGVCMIGHQEIILEAVELLKNFYYDLDRENIQLLALRLSGLAHSLYSQLRKTHQNCSVVSTQVLADVANVVSAVKALVCWLDRSPFCDNERYKDMNTDLLNLSLEMAMSGMRDRFADKPVDNILHSCKLLAELADTLVQEENDSLFLQPSSLDLATLKKRPGDHVGFIVVPSFHGALQVSELKCNSAAHQCGKIEAGDEIVQINYQTVVGWKVKEVMALLFEESSTEILITLKKRPRHSKVFGNMYFFTRYRLPCKKQLSYPTKWNDLLSPPRAEILSVPTHFRTLLRILSKPTIDKIEDKETKATSPPSPTPSTASSCSSSSSESELMAGPSSPNSVRLYLPKPRIPVQRRATITGASPVSKHAPLSLEQFWHELKLEREWRSNSNEKTGGKANSESELKRSPLLAHCSLNWSARLCEQENVDLNKSDRSTTAEKNMSEKGNENVGITPLKERIDSLNRAIEQTTNNKKPKILPKPITLTKAANIRGDTRKSPLHMVREQEISVRRERGKLDKSYSTPSYDCSVDSKEPLNFNMKLSEEKVRSAPENITSDVSPSSPLSAFKMAMDVKQQSTENKTNKIDNKLERITEHEVKPTEASQNEYLEILTCKNEDKKIQLPEVDDKVNKILDTIDSTLSFDSEPETYLKNETEVPVKTSSNYFSFDPVVSRTPSIIKHEPEFFRYEDALNVVSDTLKSNVSNPSQPTEKLYIHTTINVPATFPRHKMESKKPLSPPEPPPRPAKGSPVHSKSSKSSSNSKASLKSPPHKSPKATRKKNVWLTKRRNVTVKDLGICDHDGWLYHRTRKNSRGAPQWMKCWCVIKGALFYGFNTHEATRARLMISLPGFTVSIADEVKSRNFSFKVYHTGTTFYFAAETSEELSGWVETFSRLTMSEDEQNIVVSETDGGEEDEPPPNKKDKNSSEGYGPHLAAMKKLSGLFTSHLSGTQDSKSGDKKFNSLKKSNSRKSSTKEDQQADSHVASLDRKYLKFFSSSSSKMNFNPVPTAQFRSYRRVPPMVEKPFCIQETNLTSELKSDSLATVPLPSASPTRPPDMADYRLASLAKCGANNQRTLENASPGGYMTLESFMLTRQEEERRYQSQQLRSTNILRVPQCHAPPPPTPVLSHSAAVATGHEPSSSSSPSSSFLSTSGSFINIQPIKTISEKKWPELSSHNQQFLDTAGSTSSIDLRQNYLKKSAQYQPPPWDPPMHRLNDESRLQPAFEMTLDRHPLNEIPSNSKKKSEESSSSSRFKNLFSSSSKSDSHKTNLISSPRLRKVIFRDKKNQGQSPSLTAEPAALDRIVFCNISNPEPVIVPHPPEGRLTNAPDYPGLEYPPVFEPGSYSLSDVSNLLRGTRMRSFDSMDNDLSSKSNEFPDLVSDLTENANNNESFNQDENQNINNQWRS